jgi:hypothetical protein
MKTGLQRRGPDHAVVAADTKSNGRRSSHAAADGAQTSGSDRCVGGCTLPCRGGWSSG